MSTFSNLVGPKREWNATVHESVHEKELSRGAKTEPDDLAAKLLSVQAEDDDRGIPHLLIQGLVERLPKPDSVWSLDDRGRWFRTAASIFDLVYKASDSEHRKIAVEAAVGKAEVGSSPDAGL